jgi:hypothetical protein
MFCHFIIYKTIIKQKRRSQFYHQTPYGFLAPAGPQPEEWIKECVRPLTHIASPGLAAHSLFQDRLSRPPWN